MQCRVIIGTLALDRVNIMLTMNCEKMINQATTYTKVYFTRCSDSTIIHYVFENEIMYCDLLWVEYYFFANLLA